MTFVPGSPPEIRKNSNGLSVKDPRLIANMTVIVDDEVKTNLLMLNNGTSCQVVQKELLAVSSRFYLFTKTCGL